LSDYITNSRPFSAATRAENLDRLAQETFDLLKAFLGEKACSLKIPWTAGRTGIRLVAELFPRSPAAFYLDKIREMNHKYWVCDISRAREELGFTPRYDLSRGLKETVEWYRTAGWL